MATKQFGMTIRMSASQLTYNGEVLSNGADPKALGDHIKQYMGLNK